MAFPKILQKIFENAGAGPKVRSDVLPVATSSVTGVVKPGSGVSVASDGSLTVTSATKATQDGNGKNIASTYATVASLNTVSSTASSAATAASNAQTTATNAATAASNAATAASNAATAASNADTKAGQRVLMSGSRGSLAGYETNGTNTTINASAPDSNQTGSNITVQNGSSGTSWTKVVRVTSAVSVTLGSSWTWVGGSAPTIKSGGILVCCWCGSGGIASFASPS